MTDESPGRRVQGRGGFGMAGPVSFEPCGNQPPMEIHHNHNVLPGGARIFAVSDAGYRIPPYPGKATLKYKLPPGWFLDWMDGRPIVGPFKSEEDVCKHYRRMKDLAIEEGAA